MVQKRFSTAQDLLLVDAVNKENPFFAAKKEQAWTNVADQLNQIPNQMFGENLLDWKACRNRVDILLKAFKREDVRNSSKSGTEEEYGFLEELLSNLSNAQQEAVDLKKARVEKKKKQDAEREAQQKKANAVILEAGELAHPAENAPGAVPTDEELVAMGALDPAELQRVAGNPADDEDNDNGTSKTLPIRDKKRKYAKSDEMDGVVSYFAAADEKQLKIRGEEVELQKRIRAMELENEKELKEKEWVVQREMKEMEVKTQLQVQKEIKGMELEVKKEIELKRLDNDALRIASEERKWEAMIALLNTIKKN